MLSNLEASTIWILLTDREHEEEATRVRSSLPSKMAEKKSVSFASDIIPSGVIDFTGMVDDSNDVIADSSTSLNTWKILSSEYRTMSSRTTLIAIQAHALGSYMDCW